MDLPTTLSYLRSGWYKGIGRGFQINLQLGTLLATLVVSILLTRVFIRRRNSVLRSIQGPPSSSHIFGWSLWYTLLCLPGSFSGTGNDVNVLHQNEVGDWTFKCAREYGPVWYQSGCLGVRFSLA